MEVAGHHLAIEILAQYNSDSVRHLHDRVTLRVTLYLPRRLASLGLILEVDMERTTHNCVAMHTRRNILLLHEEPNSLSLAKRARTSFSTHLPTRSFAASELEEERLCRVWYDPEWPLTLIASRLL